MENKKQINCQCSRDFAVELARVDDYGRFKAVLDRGRHPGFVGRQMFGQKVNNGGALFFRFGQRDVAVALVNPRINSLLVLNVAPEHRGHGLGKAILDYLSPLFSRVIESAVPFFEACGYVRLGRPFKGKRHLTWVMIRRELIDAIEALDDLEIYSPHLSR